MSPANPATARTEPESRAPGVDPCPTLEWGNAAYVDLSVGQSSVFRGHRVALLSVINDWCTVSVDGDAAELRVARHDRPTVVNGVRVFVADNRPVADLTAQTAFPLTHAALSGDALLCLSDPGQPLLDPRRFTFPVSRADGFRWTMDENSGMFAYLRPDRSHEGIDINLHDARGRERHAVTAVEEAIVREIALGQTNEACLILESLAQPGLYYVYQHLYSDKISVRCGDTVSRGRALGYIWGDWRWGHLHFAVVSPGVRPVYATRYQCVLNCFPQLYELWHGCLDRTAEPVTSGDFRFAREYWRDGNRRRLHAYSDTIGYGWRLGSWCAAGKVEASFANDGTHSDESARLGKVMHRQTRLPATNPDNWLDFEVAVVPGEYAVKAEVGDRYGPTWQRIELEGADAGTFDLPEGRHAWTEEKRVQVEDGYLTVRLHFKDPQTPAALRALHFVKTR